MKLQLAYVGMDEVQRAQAVDLSHYWGVSLATAPHFDRLEASHLGGAIVSFDALSHADQARWAWQLIALHMDYPVAAHGYNLGENLTALLREHDIPVFSKLDGKVFASLLRVPADAIAM